MVMVYQQSVALLSCTNYYVHESSPKDRNTETVCVCLSVYKVHFLFSDYIIL